MKPAPRSRRLRSVLIPLNLIIVAATLISLLVGTPPVTPIATALVIAAVLSALEIISRLGVWQRVLAPLAASVRWLPPIAFTKMGILRAALILIAGLGLLAWGIVRGDAKPLATAPCLSRPAGASGATRELNFHSSVWLVDPEERSEQKLIAGSGPEWSPDGQSLAFLDGTYDGPYLRAALCIVRADGTEARSVGQTLRDLAAMGGPFSSCNDGTHYSWSTDVPMLVYTFGGMMYTFSLKQAGETPEELTGGSGPALSPDGKKVAFSSLEPIGPEAHCGIWVVYTDDRDRHELLFPKGTAPAFSPDGGQIAFVDGDQIMVGRSTGGQAKVVVDVAPTEEREYGLSLNQLTWSPDGTKLAYVYDWTRLFVVELTEGATPLDFGKGSNPSWSPDGDQLVFSRDEGDGACTIYTADADSGDVRKLTPGCDPDWSPDGTRIAFTR